MAEAKDALPAAQPQAVALPDDEVLYELADLVVRHIQGFRLRRGHCFLYFRHVDISLRCGFT